MRAREFIIEEVAFDTNNMRLVRVQNDLKGIGQDKNGIYLYRYGKASRQTMHFAINGVVGGHEMGNWDKAMVVIIADPKQINAPMSGARIEDAWYRVDDDGRLYLGNPTILVPAGTDNPDKLPVQEYQGDRNQAVNQYLQSQGIQPLNIGRNSIASINMTDYSDTVSDIIKKHGGEATGEQHFGSFDDRIDSAVTIVSRFVDAAQTQGYFDTNENGTFNNTEQARNMAASTTKEIDQYIKSNPKSAQRSSKWFQNVKQQLATLVNKTHEIDQKYKNSGFLFLIPGQKPFGPIPDEKLVNYAIYYAQNYPGSTDRIELAKNWPSNGKPYESSGTLSEIFPNELRAYTQKTPPPLPQQQAQQPPPLPQQQAQQPPPLPQQQAQQPPQKS